MKKSIIRDILYGLRGNADNMRFFDGEKELLKNLINIQNDIESKLSPEYKKELTALLDAVAAYNSAENDSCFVEGFKLGLRIGVECTDE